MEAPIMILAAERTNNEIRLADGTLYVRQVVEAYHPDSIYKPIADVLPGDNQKVIELPGPEKMEPEASKQTESDLYQQSVAKVGSLKKSIDTAQGRHDRIQSIADRRKMEYIEKIRDLGRELDKAKKVLLRRA